MTYPEITVDVLRVFADEDGQGGNLLGIIMDADTGERLDDGRWQRIATYLGSQGINETVFINQSAESDPADTANVSIFTAVRPVAFASPATIGVAWLLSQEGRQVRTLRSQVSDEPEDKIIDTWFERDMWWVRTSLSGTFARKLVKRENREEVEDSRAGDGLGRHFVWAWINKAKKIVRARSFLGERGIPEDHGDGTASMQLALRFGGEFEVHHGLRSSVIYARAKKRNAGQIAEVGGRVVRDAPLVLVLE